MSEIKKCGCRCTMWKAHLGLFNGTVEQLCSITFRAAEIKMSACQCECVEHRRAANMRAARCFFYCDRNRPTRM